MMTLMAQLCAMCAMSALIQMALPEKRLSGGIRVLSGLLMLHLTLSGLTRLCEGLVGKQDLMEMLGSLLQ